MLQIYDRVLTSISEETLVALFSPVAGLYALYRLFDCARRRAMKHVSVRLQNVLHAEVHIAAFRNAVFKRRDFPASLQDIDAVRNALSSPVALAVFDLPWTSVFIGALFNFHPRQGWLAVACSSILLPIALINQVSIYLRGEALAVVGRNDCGKGTLARALTGLVLPNIGEVRLGGTELSQ